MKPLTVILTFVFGVAGNFAPAEEDDAFLARFEKTFEPGGAVPAKDFVPGPFMAGKLHTVGAEAFNDGLRNTYFLYVSGREMEITGTHALIERIREIDALDRLRGWSKTEEFEKALAKAGKAKVENVIGLAKDPFGTIKRVPKGASRFFGRIGESLKGGRSEEEGKPLASITGVSKAKVQLAAKLGVDPYTTNEELQQELSSVARAMAGGGLVVDAAGAAVGGPAGTAVSALGINTTLQDALVNSTPEDLRIINRKNLLALGVDRPLVDEFLMHPWFSPWHESIITEALVNIGVNPSAFLADAVKALTPEDAFYFQRLAQILAKYHAETAPLRSVRMENGVVAALDKDGVLVIPVSLDYGIWAERAARRLEEFSSMDRSQAGISGLAVWADGRLSPRLCEELTKRGVAYRMDAIDVTAR